MHINFEDIDTAEMIAELGRHLARLETLIADPPAGCNEHPEGAALLSYAGRMRSHTLGVLGAWRNL